MPRFLFTVSAVLVCVVLLVWRLSHLSNPTQGLGSNSGRPQHLLLYCAAGLRLPMEKIVNAYQLEYGTRIEVHYGGSNTLLSQLELAQTGDLFLAADEMYLQLADERNLVAEQLPVAYMRPVIAVQPGNPHEIHRIEDLLRDDVKTALGNPDQAAIGQATRKLLTAAGTWEAIEKHVTRTGVFHPTVPEVANDVKLGSVEAGVVWDTTARLVGLEAIRVPELDAGRAAVALGVLHGCQDSVAALHFARFVTARDRGLPAFDEAGFEVVEGDLWSERPALTFYCGAVNRRAVDQIVAEFSAREGVTINTVYNGCGILTAQMRTIRQQQQGAGFPDTYMACDRYYLDSVKDWFQEDADVSDTSVVIVVPAGNPRHIRGIQDLTAPGLRVTLGQPDQCTIGVITRQLLRASGYEAQIQPNIVQETASSALLIPTVITGAADATFAYYTDTRAEADKIDVIRLDQREAQAIQPFAIARSSDHKYLARRLFAKVLQSRASFEKAGFHFRGAARQDPLGVSSFSRPAAAMQEAR